MNVRIVYLFVICLFGVPMTVQAGDIEGNITLTSDYVFRGFSQTNEKPAIQGGFDYGFATGFYLGTWASNVNFGDDASSEVDLYAGYAFDLTESVSLDFSYVYFAYPGETKALNYSEYVANAGVGDFNFSLVYSTDYFGSDANASIFNIDYETDIFDNVNLSAHIGYSDVDQDSFFSAGKDSYLDYSIGLHTSVKGVDFSLTAYATNLDNIDLADDRIVFSISKSL